VLHSIWRELFFVVLINIGWKVIWEGGGRAWCVVGKCVVRSEEGDGDGGKVRTKRGRVRWG
jgi:hypothetical protein